MKLRIWYSLDKNGYHGWAADYPGCKALYQRLFSDMIILIKGKYIERHPSYIDGGSRPERVKEHVELLESGYTDVFANNFIKDI